MTPCITRDECVICGTSLSDGVHTALPIYMGTTTQPINEDVEIDAEWSTCVKCGCIQLRHLVPAEIIYTASHTPGTVGSTWSLHHTQFAQFIQKNAKNTSFVEIGAGNLQLYKILSNKSKLKYTVIDPTAVEDSDIIHINRLLENITHTDLVADNIIHSHTLEHFYRPLDMLTVMNNILADNGMMFMSVPLTDVQLQHGHTNALQIEHTYSITFSNLIKLLDASNFSVHDVTMFSPYCVFVCAVKYKSTSYINFLQNLHADIEYINACDVPVYLFGAHSFSQSLAGGLTVPVISILDNDVNKIGKRLYNTPHIVCSPDRIQHDLSPHVVVRAAQYTDEIRHQLKNINQSVVFI